MKKVSNQVVNRVRPKIDTQVYWHVWGQVLRQVYWRVEEIIDEAG